MAVALRRQAEQWQRAEKRTEFVDRPPLHKHQGSGRGAKGLGSGGDRSSFQDRPLEFRQPTNGPIGRQTASNRSATQQFLIKLGNRGSPFKPLIVTQQRIAASKNLTVI